MKIIKRGILPSERDMEAHCMACKTVFEFTPSKDAKRVNDQRDGDSWKVACPVCGRQTYVSVAA